MRRLAVATALALAVSGFACSGILGLQEPTIDDSLGDGSTPDAADGATADAPAEAAPDAGGPVQLLNARVRRIALDDTSVYYTDMFDYVVGRIGKDGTGQVALANGSAIAGYFPNTIAVDATDVFWTSVAGVHQCAKSGCGNAPIHVIDDNSSWSPGSLAVDATTIYFVNYDGNAPTGQQYSIHTVPKGAANGTVSTLAAAAALPCATINRMKLYGTYLYITCDEGPIARIPTAGGAFEVLSNAAAPPGADTFVADTSSIYFGQFLEQASLFQMPIQADAGATTIALSQPYVNAMDVDGNYLYWATVGVSLDNGAGAVERCPLSACASNVQKVAGSIDVPTDLALDSTTIFWAANGNGDTPNTGIWKMAKPQ